MFKNSGFILVMTLLTVAVISLLVLSSMQHILLFHKAMNTLEQHYQHRVQLESIGMKLLQKNASTSCVASWDFANKSMQKLLNYEGCRVEDSTARFLYIIEDLGEFPCLLIREKNKVYSSHHKRVSVLLLNEEGRADSLMQLRYISAINYLGCTEEEQEVRPGISSWRYFAGISDNDL
ncbi:MAG: type II secretion system protein [Legionella sp.]|jgi:hypothetical protein